MRRPGDDILFRWGGVHRGSHYPGVNEGVFHCCTVVPPCFMHASLVLLYASLFTRQESSKFSVLHSIAAADTAFFASLCIVHVYVGWRRCWLPCFCMSCCCESCCCMPHWCIIYCPASLLHVRCINTSMFSGRVAATASPSGLVFFPLFRPTRTSSVISFVDYFLFCFSFHFFS